MSTVSQAPAIQQTRTLEARVRGVATSDGAGVNLLRVLQQAQQVRLDPFLLLDEFRSDDASDYIAGFPDHPHRGFETVTYMLDGNMRHRDSAGHEGNLTAGSVQWMTAGRGIVHSEMPQQEDGLMHGFQLWVNLPAQHKLCAPRYQEFGPDEIPEYQLDSGAQVKVIAGDSCGVQGAVKGIVTAPLYLDVRLPPAVGFEHPVPQGHNAFVYVFEGAVYVGPAQDASALATGELGILSNSQGADGIRLTTCDRDTRFLLLAGNPLGEPIVQWGPFVMNTAEEIEEAMQAYRDGRLTQGSH